MKKTAILVVDDEPRILRFVKTSLSLSGYELITASNGQDALSTFEDQQPQLIILDLGLPDMDGFEVLQEIRSYSTIPIVILTARDEEEAKIRGLELGADDYITKPFGIGELKARIQAVMRRVKWSPQPNDLSEFKYRDLYVDFQRRKVFARNEEVHLTPTEYDLLRVLIQHAGQVLLHGDLLSDVWGEEYRNDLAILRVNISRLRQKIEIDPRDPQYIMTIPGVGYSLSTD